MEGTLHATVRMRDVVLEQIRVVGLRLRTEALVTALVIAIITVRIVIDIVRGDAATWFDSVEWFPLAVVAFLAPFAVWRGERRFGPAFLWTLPVDRRALALAKVFAGWVWVMTACATFMVWQAVLAAMSGIAGARTLTPLAFVGASAAYFWGSALVVGLRHPLRWVFGTAGGFFLLASLNEALGRTAAGRSRMFDSTRVLRWLIYGPYGLDKILGSRELMSTLDRATTLITFLFLGAALVALWAALSRHGERRRH